MGFDQTLVSLYVFSRLSGLLMAAPVLGSRSVPLRLRAGLVLVLTLMVAPVYWTAPVEQPASLLEMAGVLLHEIVIGLSLALGMTMLLLGIQMAGHIAGQMSGMALADVLEPSFGMSSTTFAQLMDVIGVSVFILIGGHRIVIGALLDTFQWMPPGTRGALAIDVTPVAEILTQSFALAIRAAAPMIVSLVLSVLALGLVSRSLPQLNILAVGLSVNSIIMLATLALSLGGVAWALQDQIETAIVMLLQSLAPIAISPASP